MSKTSLKLFIVVFSAASISCGGAGADKPATYGTVTAYIPFWGSQKSAITLA